MFLRIFQKYVRSSLYNLGDVTLKKKYNFFAAAVLTMIAVSASSVAMIDIDTAAKQYAEKSTQNALRNETVRGNKLDDFRTDDKIKDLEDQISEYDKQYNDLDNILYISGETAAKRYQNKMDEIALEQYKLKYELAEYKYKQSENVSYSSFCDKINSYDLAKEAYGYYEQFLKYKVDLEYIKYTKELIKYFEEIIEIRQTQLETGYAMDIDVLSAKAELSSAQADLLQYENSVSYVKKYLSTVSGVPFENYSDFNISKPSRSAAKQAFERNSSESQYHKSQMKNLADYSSALEALSFDIDNYAALSPYRLYPIDDDVLKELDSLSKELNSEAALQISYISKIKLEIKQKETDTSLFIDRLFGELEVYDAELKANQAQIAVAEEQVRVNTLLLESGKILPSELHKSQVDLNQLNAAKASLESEIQKICYRLSNGIYYNS